MKLIETITKQRDDYDENDLNDCRVTVELVPEKNLSTNKPIRVSFGHGEPEDMFLCRDLNSAYSIFDLVRMAHAAGANGEPLILERLEEISEY